MDRKIVKLSDAVSKLLDEDNKNKSLGEVSEELNTYLIEIKELVESNEISYDTLKDEIKKHVQTKDSIKPGSVAQILVGCINDECPLHKETAEDVSFIYDSKSHTILPLSKYSNPLSRDSYAVLYINGDPTQIKVEALKTLENLGFQKLKIKHKAVNESSYKTMNIENISKYIYYNNTEFSKKGLLTFSAFVILLLLIYMYHQKK
jgi:hypothetical protein